MLFLSCSKKQDETPIVMPKDSTFCFQCIHEVLIQGTIKIHENITECDLTNKQAEQYQNANTYNKDSLKSYAKCFKIK